MMKNESTKNATDNEYIDNDIYDSKNKNTVFYYFMRDAGEAEKKKMEKKDESATVNENTSCKKAYKSQIIY